jgi:cysteine desulfurase
VANAFCRDLKRALPGVELVGTGDRLWNTVSVVMPELSSRQRWLVKLDKLGIAVSTGSACSSGEEKPSHVLRRCNCRTPAPVGLLRFSSGWETSESDWKELVEAIMRVWKSADEIAPRSGALRRNAPRRA